MCPSRLGSRILSFKTYPEISLMVQRLTSHLPVQRAQVLSLVREDPACFGATKPTSHSYWGQAPSSPCSATREAAAVRSPCTTTKVAPAHRNWRKPMCTGKDPAEPKMTEINKMWNPSFNLSPPGIHCILVLALPRHLHIKQKWSVQVPVVPTPLGWYLCWGRR